MSYSQGKIDKLIEGLNVLLQKEKEVEKLRDNLKVYGLTIDDKQFQMRNKDFLNRFENYEIQDRQTEEYPYQLLTKVGEYTIITLLTAKEFYRLLHEGVISEVEEIAKV